MRIRLEHFLTPNHLALIARDCSLAAARGLALVLEEPREHDDGFANLEHGRCDLILTGPLHLLEPVARAGEPLGCLFETERSAARHQDLAHRRGPGLARRPRQGAPPQDRRR